ncbi:MAG: cytochrome c [Bacteroidia bacterium]
MKYIRLTIITVLLAVVAVGCSYQDGDRNIEYAPNMYHSIPLEPYTQVTDEWYTEGLYYKGVTKQSIFKDGLNAQKPVKGTIPRADSWIRQEAFTPYHQDNSPESYAWAGDSLFSPLPKPERPHTQKGVLVDWATAEDFAKGKEVYEQLCIMCHGAKGDGGGTVPTKSEQYPGVPSYKSAAGTGLKNLPEGKMFHTLTYGKNAMGSYASQATPRQRWQVISYIKHFQRLD